MIDFGTMKRLLQTIFVVAALSLSLVASSAAAESLYVRASGTDLKEKAGPGGKTLTKLEIGTKCRVVAREGAWTKVTVKGADKKETTGYVFKAKLSEDKPDKERFGGAVTASATEGDTAMALRGLSATSEKYAERADIKPEDIAAVKKMEKRKVAQDEIDEFLRDGKLAEYAE